MCSRGEVTTWSTTSRLDSAHQHSSGGWRRMRRRCSMTRAEGQLTIAADKHGHMNSIKPVQVERGGSGEVVREGGSKWKVQLNWGEKSEGTTAEGRGRGSGTLTHSLTRSHYSIYPLLSICNYSYMNNSFLLLLLLLRTKSCSSSC